MQAACLLHYFGVVNFGRLITPERIRFLQGETKEEALDELIGIVSSEPGAPNAQLIRELVRSREEQVSTALGGGVALPHARVPDLEETLAAVGISRGGIRYDENRVHVVVLVLWAGTPNLAILSDLGRLLRRPDLFEEIVAAPDERALHRLFTDPPARIEREPETIRRAHTTVRRAFELARDLEADALLVFPDAMRSLAFAQPDLFEGREKHPSSILLVTSEPRHYQDDEETFDRVVDIPVRGATDGGLAATALLFVMSRGHIPRSGQVVSVFGRPDSGVLDTIRFTDLDREFADYFHRDAGSIHSDTEEAVFARVVQIALDLAREGREGKPAGTLFVVGDYETVSSYCQQLLINPFRGYSADQRNILDPGLEETVKEFSRIDGAFVITGTGTIVSGGTYLRTGDSVSKLPGGLGARHTAAAGITAVTRSIAVAISESTKRVSIFHRGTRLMVL